MKKMLSLVVTVMLSLSVLSGAMSFTSSVLNPANMRSVSNDMSNYFDDLISSAIYSVSTGDFNITSVLPKLGSKADYRPKATIVIGYEAHNGDNKDEVLGFSN